MKCIYPFFILLMICQATRAQNNAFYGHDMVMPLREESNTNSKCNIIQLAGGIVVKDCDDATSSYAISDHRGSTRTILDGNLANKVSCDYDAYGNISADVPDNLKEQCRYTKTYRWSNNYQLYFAPERVYSPTAKRFLGTDMEQYNFSPYLYANANPVTFLDVDGRAPRRYWDIYPQYLYYKVNSEIEGLLGHPSLPQNLTFDEGSLRTLAKMKPGHAFVGVIHQPSGKMYLSPVARRTTGTGAFWSGDDFTETIEMAGRTYPQIVHGENGIVAHLQLTYRIEKDVHNNPFAQKFDAKEFLMMKSMFPDNDYLGFGLRWEKSSSRIYVTTRSRSLNHRKFYREFNVSDADQSLYNQLHQALEKDIHNEMPELAEMKKDDTYFDRFNEALEVRLQSYDGDKYKGYQVYALSGKKNEYGLALPDGSESVEQISSRATMAADRFTGRISYGTLPKSVHELLNAGFLNQTSSKQIVSEMNNIPEEFKPFGTWGFMDAGY